MPKRDRDTTMGGARGAFRTTRWSQIRRAGTANEQRRQASINNLIQRYWKPVYCYLRRKGHSNDRAKDLTQGFFCEIVLGRELIQKAEACKGRFRTFLLTALDRYVTSVHRKESARKRLPAGGLGSLDLIEPSDSCIPLSGASPEQAFCYAWATSLLDQVLAQVKEEYCGTGREAYWQVFRAKVVAPAFENVESVSLDELCRAHGIETEKKASNMMITVKRRFAAVLRDRLRLHVRSDADVEHELRDLVQVLLEGSVN